MLAAAKADDGVGVETAKEAWYANGDAIADFLAAAVPDKPAEELRTEMKSHLDLTLEEAVARLEGRYVDDLAAYDSVHEHILHFADVLSSGIVAQYPTQFETDSTATEMELRAALDKLWEDHITWTRQYIVSTVANLADETVVAERLIQNQADIADAFRPYYGDDAANSLNDLLTEHIGGAVAILEAAKAGDDAALEGATDAWYTNGNEIAAFLSAANPESWPQEDMEAEMKSHLDLTLDEAVARLEGRAADDIATYDAVHEHILHLSGALSDGIIAQFPDMMN